MTPKEKAEELVYRFMQPIDGLHKYPMCFDTAKQCALIAVDEIIKIGSVIVDYNTRDYWQEVKKLIEKL